MRRGQEMASILDSETKSNKIFMFIGNLITILTGVITFISWILKVILKKMEGLPPIALKITTYVLNTCVVLFVLGVIIFVIRLIIVAIKTNAKAFYIQRKLVTFIHTKLIHRIRNDIIELEPISLKIKQFSKDDNLDAIRECYHNELCKMQAKLQVYIDALAEYLSDYRQDTISVCVKVFKSRDRKRSEFVAEEIVALVRSSNTKEERENDVSAIIGQNTDFTNLCRGQIVFFGSGNLSKLAESGQYINDSKNWSKENKYISTLVTPIRYYNNDEKNNIKTDVIGFLCIDSKEQIYEWEKTDSFELQMLGAFSDILYVYIKEFYSCFENVGILLE